MGLFDIFKRNQSMNRHTNIVKAGLLLLLTLTNCACSPTAPTLVTYERHGVSFVHYSDWRVTNDAVTEEQTRTIDLEGPNDTIVSIVLFPSSIDLDLDEFATSFARERGSAVKASTSIGSFSAAKLSAASSQAASADVGGQQRSGILQKFSIYLLGQEVPHEAKFFLVPDQQSNAVIITHVATEHAATTAAAFSATLRSFRLSVAK